MPMKLNQFAVYRVDQQTAGKALWHTFNQSLQKRLRSFAEKYPDDCWLKGSSEDGSETYMIKKGRLSLNLRPPYSKDRIHKANL